MKALVAGLLLAWLVAPVQAAPKLQPMPLPDTSCTPVNGLSFVCGPRHPEDAIAIPETRWLLISGLTPGSGLGVIDMNAKIAYFLYTAKTAKALDRRYPGCSAPPDPASFATHGLSLRATAPGRYRLYVVSHGALESIQVFELDAPRRRAGADLERLCRDGGQSSRQRRRVLRGRHDPGDRG